MDGAGAPSIAEVSPRSVAVGLTAEVAIAGSSTSWTNAAQVTFGAGVAVKSLRLASPTSLVATVVVAADAAPGPREVTVTEGSSVVKYTAFAVVPYAEVTVQGTPAQGSLLRLTLVVNDPMFVFPPPEAIFQGGGTTRNRSTLVKFFPTFGATLVRATKVLARTMEVEIGINIDAAPGNYALILSLNRDETDERTLVFPDLLAVVSREALPFTSNSVPVAFSAPFGSALFDLGAEGPAFGTVFTASPTAELAFFGGAWNPFATVVGNGVVYQTNFRYLAVFDATGAGGTSTVSSALPTAIAEVEPNDTQAMAQVLPAVPVRVSSSVTNTDVDWFKVTVPASAVDHRLALVSTGDGTTAYNFLVEVTQRGVPLADPFQFYSSDGQYVSNVTAPIPAAGDIFLKVSTPDTAASTGSFTIFIE